MSNNRSYWFDINGKREPDESSMVAELLEKDILFLNSYKCIDAIGEVQSATMVLLLNCNDVFAWGCADAESVTLDELPVLFDMYEQNGECGPTQWVCIKRNEQPQLPVIDWLKEHNCWTSQLNDLPTNKYDLMLQREFNIKKKK